MENDATIAQVDLSDTRVSEIIRYVDDHGKGVQKVVANEDSPADVAWAVMLAMILVAFITNVLNLDATVGGASGSDDHTLSC